MFYKMPEASKVCLAKLVEIALANDFISLTVRFRPPIWKSWVPLKSQGQTFSTNLMIALQIQTKNFNWNKFDNSFGIAHR